MSAMKDHASASSRLATGRAIVCMPLPDWTLEILGSLVVLLGIAVLCTLGKLAMVTAELREARGDIDRVSEGAAFWQELALAPDTAPTVRVERDGTGFQCASFNVRREWEAAVTAECRRMGALLLQARAEP